MAYLVVGNHSKNIIGGWIHAPPDMAHSQSCEPQRHKRFYHKTWKRDNLFFSSDQNGLIISNNWSSQISTNSNTILLESQVMLLGYGGLLILPFVSAYQLWALFIFLRRYLRFGDLCADLDATYSLFIPGDAVHFLELGFPCRLIPTGIPRAGYDTVLHASDLASYVMRVIPPAETAPAGWITALVRSHVTNLTRATSNSVLTAEPACTLPGAVKFLVELW